MVSRRRGPRGTSTVGCLLSLALFAAAVFYGVRIGEVYVRYYELLDAMRSQARLAPSLEDAVIQRRLVERSDSLFDGRRLHFRIRRGGNPTRITIQTEYTEQLALPFFKHTFVFKPKAEERL